jgi:hypothetical protein
MTTVILMVNNMIKIFSNVFGNSIGLLSSSDDWDLNLEEK